MSKKSREEANKQFDDDMDEIKQAWNEMKDAWNEYSRISNFKKKVLRAGTMVTIFAGGVMVGVWAANAGE